MRQHVIDIYIGALIITMVGSFATYMIVRTIYTLPTSVFAAQPVTLNGNVVSVD
jgi:hypothetical protein